MYNTMTNTMLFFENFTAEDIEEFMNNILIDKNRNHSNLTN